MYTIVKRLRSSKKRMLFTLRMEFIHQLCALLVNPWIIPAFRPKPREEFLLSIYRDSRHPKGEEMCWGYIKFKASK